MVLAWPFHLQFCNSPQIAHTLFWEKMFGYCFIGDSKTNLLVGVPLCFDVLQQDSVLVFASCGVPPFSGNLG